ncbi:MAG: BrnT family toxin [Treponema sp.]|nr:BrnT family toxin [Treponema sp.]
MRFTWDEKKNLVNVKKHKISFVQAAHVFSDPLRKELYDEKHSRHDEDRVIAIGMAVTRLIFVSFTEPDTETVHIISARKANERERRYYYGNG